MNLQSFHTIYFSPTSTTATMTAALAQGITHDRKLTPIKHDCTFTPFAAAPFSNQDLVLIGAPVYAGRIAPLALQRFASLQGSDTPAIALVMYGNRAFEDALLELHDFLCQRGFRVIGGCAGIGEHSYANTAHPIATGRPDSRDTALAEAMGKNIIHTFMEKETERAGNSSFLQIPGNRPYKKGIQATKTPPAIEKEHCVLCGNCISSCPTGALTLQGEISIAAENCILCCACIRTCEEEAISLKDKELCNKIEWLSSTCKARKEPEFFF